MKKQVFINNSLLVVLYLRHQFGEVVAWPAKWTTNLEYLWNTSSHFLGQSRLKCPAGQIHPRSSKIFIWFSPFCSIICCAYKSYQKKLWHIDMSYFFIKLSGAGTIWNKIELYFRFFRKCYDTRIVSAMIDYGLALNFKVSNYLHVQNFVMVVF